MFFVILLIERYYELKTLGQHEAVKDYQIHYQPKQ
jgi:hypothetical protein